MYIRPVGWTAILMAILFGFPSGGAAEERVAPPAKIAELVRKALPDTWTCDNEPTGLVVRPTSQPVFVNLVNAEGPRQGEAEDRYIRRHTVKIRYRIVLRFGPKISADQIGILAAENLRIRRQLRAIEGSPLNEAFKGGDAFFPDTREGRALTKQYQQLKRSIQPIPYGYLGNVSVYIEPTFLGFTRFLRKDSERECEAVRKQITALFTPYKREAPNQPN